MRCASSTFTSGLEIRELQNRVQRAIIMADGKRAPPATRIDRCLGRIAAMTLKEAREGVERELVQEASRGTEARSRPLHWNSASAGQPYELTEKLESPGDS
jgi:two-component system NtrC family response regulator